MQHSYFTDDGFPSWFEEELKQMLDRDAQAPSRPPHLYRTLYGTTCDRDV